MPARSIFGADSDSRSYSTPSKRNVQRNFKGNFYNCTTRFLFHADRTQRSAAFGGENHDSVERKKTIIFSCTNLTSLPLKSTQNCNIL